MGITTTYTCDHCKSTSCNRDDVQWIAIMTTEHQFTNYSTPNNSLRKQELWCKPCLVLMGVIGAGHAKEVAAIIPPPSMEDIVREICRNECEGMIQDSRG